MLAKDPEPAAFMSYVRSDDQIEGGRLTQFRERLSEEVRMQTGRRFPIFQDRKNILWGENWKKRIEESLDAATFLIPILTPSFFESKQCRDELKRFHDRENDLRGKALFRENLILPIYYVDCPVLNDETRRRKDELAELVCACQYADWRQLRFEGMNSTQVKRSLEQLALRIRDALEQAQKAKETASRLLEQLLPWSKSAPRPAAKTAPPEGAPGAVASEALIRKHLEASEAERSPVSREPIGGSDYHPSSVKGEVHLLIYYDQENYNSNAMYKSVVTRMLDRLWDSGYMRAHTMPGAVGHKSMLRFNRIGPEIVSEVQDLIRPILLEHRVNVRVVHEGDPPNVAVAQSFLFIQLGKDLENQCKDAH